MMAADIQDGRLIKFGNTDTRYEVPEYVTQLADLAFSDCDRLIALHIPDSVTEIGNYAFAGCYSLREIRLPASVSRIGAGLFQKCWNIRDIRLPEGLVSLGSDMFEGCHALYSVSLPDSLESAERTAFSSCRSLRKVYIRPEKAAVLPASARYLATLTYMEEHGPEQGSDLIDEYISARSRSILDLAVNRRSAEAVRYMLGRHLISPEMLSDYLERSVSTGRVEITALLLEYSRNDHSGSPDPDPFV